MGAALFIAMSGRCGMCLLDDPLTLIVERGVASSKIRPQDPLQSRAQ
jgi:hypothetical protein